MPGARYVARYIAGGFAGLTLSSASSGDSAWHASAVPTALASLCKLAEVGGAASDVTFQSTKGEGCVALLATGAADTARMNGKGKDGATYHSFKLFGILALELAVRRSSFFLRIFMRAGAVVVQYSKI